MAGDAEFLLVDLLGDGERQMIPLLITLLLVGRYGIMYLRFNAVVCEISLQFVAARTENGEDMIDAIAI